MGSDSSAYYLAVLVVAWLLLNFGTAEMLVFWCDGDGERRREAAYRPT